MKVLLVTDNPSLPSGLARVGREVAITLHDKFDFVYLGLHSLQLSDVPYKVAVCGEGYGKDFLATSTAEIILTVGDPFHFAFIPFLPNRKDFTWINYVTIDSINAVGNLPLGWQLALSNSDFLATTSRFGQEAIMNFLEVEPAYWPLGVRDEFFRMPEAERKSARELLHLDDCFIVVSVNRNCIRKQLPVILKVAQRLANQKVEGYPGGIKFLIHTNPNDSYGYNLKQLTMDYGIRNVLFVSTLQNNTFLDSDIQQGTLQNPTLLPSGVIKVRFCNVLNEIYNSGDVFLTASGGEGFGLTILEAMKCGLPIIGTNYSSIPELVNTPKPCGMLINPCAYMTTEEGTEMAILNPDEISKAVLNLATNPVKCQQFSLQAQENASNSWDTMKAGIIEALNEIEKKECTIHGGHVNTSVRCKADKVDLIVLEGTPWEDFTYIQPKTIWELSTWSSTAIQENILACHSEWVALLGAGVRIQRGWLNELLKSVTDKTAVVVSTCINARGEMIEGEIRHGAKLILFPDEGLPPVNSDKELSSTIFSCVLINRTIFELLGGFKTNLRSSYFDIEYCIRCKSSGYKIIKSAKSIILKTQNAYFDEKDGYEFKLETEQTLNAPVYIQYTGTRAKIKTIYGDLKKEPVKFPYRMALDLVANYKHIDFVDVERDINILDHIINEGGRVLIARNMGLGDVLSALYFGARPLKLANSNIHLAVCVNKPYSSLVSWLPFVDEVFIYPDGLAMAKDFDFFKDLSYIPESKDPKSQSPRPEIFANAIRDSSVVNGGSIYDYDAFLIPEAYQKKAQGTFAQLGIGKNGRKVVGIQATCESPIRVYAPEYLSELVKYLAKDYDVVLFGQEKHWRWGLENWQGEHLFSFINQTDDIETMAALVERCDYGIAPDSGLMHLWAFMKKPTLALFGNIKPENRTKYYPTVTVLYPEGELPCIPCGDVYNPCPECSDLGAKGTFSGRCMRRLYPERVYLKFLEMIGSEPKVSKIDITKCPLCGEQNFDIVNQVDYWDNGQIPECIFVKCRNDGLVFVAGDSEMIEYENDYFQSGKEKYYENILSPVEIARQTSNARRVLDEYYK